jgi:hypothetical protein
VEEKPPQQKPNGTMSFVLKTQCLFILGADRRSIPRRISSEYKIGDSNVYMRELPNPLKNTSVFQKERRSVGLSDQVDAFVLFVRVTPLGVISLQIITPKGVTLTILVANPKSKI